MNKNHLHQIFENYINRFEEFNSEDRKKPSEYYKWEMPGPFKDYMNLLINANNKDEIIEYLGKIKKLTHDFIDSGKTLPLAGLTKFVTDYGEWKTIREMFQELYANDGLDSQEKIEVFLNKCRGLERKHGLGGTYKSDYRSVTAYLFLYDPDNNYIYKPTHAQDFQDCIEFYDGFGEGDCINLKTYYRMCNELVEEIKNYPRLRELDDIRLALIRKDNKECYKDEKLHILAYDIIYCCSSYNLFRGISFEHLTPTERKVRWEKQQKAKELLVELQQVQEQQEKLDETLQIISEIQKVGAKVKHPLYGSGTIVAKNENAITINFANGKEMKFGRFESITGGYISFETEKDAARLAEIKEVLKNKSSIKKKLADAERDFAEYSAYI